jgi:ABC-type multidrug transport system ATPase subunit
VLQLEEVRGQVVGAGGARGISGGQRKRVNLGLELVAAPALLLLGGRSTSIAHGRAS